VKNILLQERESSTPHRNVPEVFPVLLMSYPVLHVTRMMSPRLTDDVTFRLPLTTVGKGQRIAETIKQLKSIICSHLYKRKLKSYTHRLS